MSQYAYLTFISVLFGSNSFSLVHFSLISADFYFKLYQAVENVSLASEHAETLAVKECQASLREHCLTTWESNCQFWSLLGNSKSENVVLTFKFSLFYIYIYQSSSTIILVEYLNFLFIYFF